MLSSTTGVSDCIDGPRRFKGSPPLVTLRRYFHAREVIPESNSAQGMELQQPGERETGKGSSEWIPVGMTTNASCVNEEYAENSNVDISYLQLGR